MGPECPECGQNVADDSVYCQHCGHGLKSSARTTQVSVAGTLLIVAAVASLVFFVLSLSAISRIYQFYPYWAEVDHDLILYDRMLKGFCLAGFSSGFLGGLLSFTRRNYRLTMLFAVLCTVSGAGAWTTAPMIPFGVWFSFLWYYLLVFITASFGTVLIYPRKPEFKQQIR